MIGISAPAVTIRSGPKSRAPNARAGPNGPQQTSPGQRPGQTEIGRQIRPTPTRSVSEGPSRSLLRGPLVRPTPTRSVSEGPGRSLLRGPLVRPTPTRSVSEGPVGRCSEARWSAPHQPEASARVPVGRCSEARWSAPHQPEALARVPVGRCSEARWSDPHQPEAYSAATGKCPDDLPADASSPKLGSIVGNTIEHIVPGVRVEPTNETRRNHALNRSQRS